MKTVLITGATSGIGMEFAKRYAQMGYRLVLVGRRMNRLEEFQASSEAECRLIQKDISNTEACKELLDDLSDETIDIFINNAGFGTTGNFTETDLEKELSMIYVNDVAMHILFKGILQKMQTNGGGSILNVASSAGLLPAGPYMATYYATKAYVVSLTRAVAHELKQMNSPVYVAALCPGPVDTEFNKNADVIFALKGISAKQCVAECLSGMERHKTIIVPSLRMKAAAFFQHFVPMPLLIKMVAGQQKKKIYT